MWLNFLKLTGKTGESARNRCLHKTFLMRCIEFGAIMLALELLALAIKKLPICRCFEYVDAKAVWRCAARPHAVGTALHQADISSANLHSMDFPPFSRAAFAGAEWAAARLDRVALRAAAFCLSLADRRI